MIFKFIYLFLISFSILFIYTGCDDTIVEEKLPEIPAENVSFVNHLQPVFELKCTGCHDDSQKAGGLSLTTWASTTNDPGVVFPGEPDNSRIVWVVEGRAGFPIMPPPESPYAPFTLAQVNGLRKWIAEGAKNN